MRSSYDTSDPAEWLAPPARPDAATLRQQIAEAVAISGWVSVRHTADGITDAVMAVLAEHGLVDQ